MSRPKSPAWASTFTSNLISSWFHDPTVPPTTSFQFPICSNHLRTLGHNACCSLCWNTLPPSSPGLVQLLILTAQIWQDSPVLCSYSLLHFSVGWEWPSRKLFQAFCGLDRYWSTLTSASSGDLWQAKLMQAVPRPIISGRLGWAHTSVFGQVPQGISTRSPNRELLDRQRNTAAVFFKGLFQSSNGILQNHLSTAKRTYDFVKSKLIQLEYRNTCITKHLHCIWDFSISILVSPWIALP